MVVDATTSRVLIFVVTAIRSSRREPIEIAWTVDLSAERKEERGFLCCLFVSPEGREFSLFRSNSFVSDRSLVSGHRCCDDY